MAVSPAIIYKKKKSSSKMCLFFFFRVLEILSNPLLKNEQNKFFEKILMFLVNIIKPIAYSRSLPLGNAPTSTPSPFIYKPDLPCSSVSSPNSLETWENTGYCWRRRWTFESSANTWWKSALPACCNLTGQSRRMWGQPACLPTLASLCGTHISSFI